MVRIQAVTLVRPSLPKSGKAAKDAHEGLLRQILDERLAPGAEEHAAEQREDRPLVALDQRAERRAVAATGRARG